MKLLISGASGLCGGALMRLAKARGHQCISLDRDDVKISIEESAVEALDACFEGVDHFVHTAANTNVEGCEADPEACFRDNTLLTELLATAASKRGVAMTFISSTGVYGSNQTKPYTEFDDVNPSTKHHRSKLLGEQAVLAANWSNLVLRTGWLFGGDAHATKNFVAMRIREASASKKEFIYSNHQQRGCPTLVDDLVVRMLDLIALRARGIFNVVNTGSASRFEYVREIIKLSGLDAEVRPVAAADFKRIAPVSDNEMAVNWRADMLKLQPMRNWKDALADYMATEEMKALTV